MWVLTASTGAYEDAVMQGFSRYLLFLWIEKHLFSPLIDNAIRNHDLEMTLDDIVKEKQEYMLKSAVFCIPTPGHYQDNW